MLRQALQLFSVEDTGDYHTSLTLSAKRSLLQKNDEAIQFGTVVVTKRSDDHAEYRFASDALCTLKLNKRNKIASLEIEAGIPLDDLELTEQARVLLRVSFETVASREGLVSLHAAAVVNDGQSICFTGPSGAGKSTLANNWLKAVHASYVLNGDRPALRQQEDGAFYAYGAPWSGKENIFVNDSAPMRAIVEVKKHCTNRIQRLDHKRAYTLLLQRISKPQWDGEATLAIIDTLTKLVTLVPVYRYYCKDTPSAGTYLYDALNNPDEIPLRSEGERDMRVKKGFVIRNVLDSHMAVPVGEDAITAQGAIMLNEVGAFLWDKLSQPITEEALLDYVLAEFDVDKEVASADLSEFLSTLRQANALDEI